MLILICCFFHALIHLICYYMLLTHVFFDLVYLACGSPPIRVAQRCDDRSLQAAAIASIPGHLHEHPFHYVFVFFNINSFCW